MACAREEKPETRDLEYNFPREYYLQNIDGTRGLLTEQLAARIFYDEGLASGFTYNLCFQAEIIELKVTLVRDSIEDGDAHTLRSEEGT